MSASGVALWSVLAGLNLGLMMLASRARVRPASRVLVALLVATNGIFAIDQAALAAGMERTSLAAATVAFALNLPVFIAFALLPFFFPRRLLSPRGEAIALAAAGMFVVGNLTLLAIHRITGQTGDINGIVAPVFGPTAWLPFTAGLALGTILLLKTFLQASAPAEHAQARLLLTAYLLKATAQLKDTLDHLGIEGLGGLQVTVEAWSGPWLRLMLGAGFLLIAPATVTIALASNRIRAAAGVRSARGDAFVLSAVPIAILVARPEVAGSPEFMVFRPLLLIYAILHHQMLSVDVASSRGVIGGTALAGVTSLFLVAYQTGTGYGLDPGTAFGVALISGFGAGGIISWPLLRLLLAPTLAIGQAHSRELYRAALQEAVAAEPALSASAEAALREMRGRLRISSREHAELEAQARVAPGGPTTGLALGSLFLGRFRVESDLGGGGFAETYLAHDTKLARAVVLKLARCPRASERKRALREARALASLVHPNVVAVHDVEEVGGEIVLVLEYVPGGSLEDALAAGPVPQSRGLAMACDILAGLEAVHGCGLVHRDLKPANILMAADGTCKLADFGIAAPSDAGHTAAGPATADPAAGTLRYMSPEQVRGERPGVASDLYSVGTILYEILSHRPYIDTDGMTEYEIRRAIVERSPKWPLSGVPKRLNDALGSLLAKDPRMRPMSAATVSGLLECQTASV